MTKTRLRFNFATLFALGTLAGISFLRATWEPTDGELSRAIKDGDFANYSSAASAWLGARLPNTPAHITESTINELIKDPRVTQLLEQHQILAIVKPDQVASFAKANPENPQFLHWLFSSPKVMEMFLQATGPTAIAERDANRYTIPAETLTIWASIKRTDPDTKEGLYEKLAIATAIAPPGSRTGGAGGGKPQIPQPLERYQHYKSAHQKHELFPSFDRLTVWEYTKVVCCHASNEDLTWAREMINTWRPDLRINERVVESTREVWRRNSPWLYHDGFKSVLSGGGKCGPRSSWAVMICQAFGIPAIGVGQPAHACVAAKTAFPELPPQVGSAWKVHQGMGWDVTRIDGTRGPEFLEAMAERAQAAAFDEIERLRWLATALANKDQSDAVRVLIGKFRKSLSLNTILTPTEEATDPNVEGVAKTSAPSFSPQATIAEPPFPQIPGTIHIEAEAFSKSFAEPVFPLEQKGVVFVLDCHSGGKQLNLQKNMQTCWVEYAINVPSSGNYQMIARTAVVNTEQILDVSQGDTKLATINIPNEYGLWTTSTPVEVKLEKGPQTLRVSTPAQRGMAIRWFELKQSK